VQPTSIERLSLIPAGPIPPNPAELLDSERFRELVESVRNRQDYDHVIYDSPPTLSVVDPLLIGRHTEGTVLVVRSAFTSRDAGRLGLEKLRSGRVNVLGVVLNAVQVEHVPYHYQQYRYGYARRNEQDAESQDPAVAQSGRKG
jgi:capsular exopolysaccharide synthesis family protein